MAINSQGTLFKLVASAIGAKDGMALLARVHIPEKLAFSTEEASFPRAVFAMALNLLLFHDLLKRVPTAQSYFDDCVSDYNTIIFDHGALRTIDGAVGALPCGYLSFARILEPLGYRVAGVYPLPNIKMTGRAFTHIDFPEGVPQFFVSELHIDQFDRDTQDAAARVFSTSVDPLGAAERAALAEFDACGTASMENAIAALPGLVKAFGCWHSPPALCDYEVLLAASAEAAWIATEGNAFNHATDRVADVVRVAEQQKALGRPMKDVIERSACGRICQTAYKADTVERLFVAADGSMIRRLVPGSFYEFISREIDPASGRLDLGFDSMNAQGIFAMTQAA
jgi:hypothetical protein